MGLAIQITDYELLGVGTRSTVFLSQCQIYNKYSLNICQMNEDCAMAVVHDSSVDLLLEISRMENDNANFYQALCTKFGAKPLILFVVDFLP